MHKARDKVIPGEGLYFLKLHKVSLMGVRCSYKSCGVGTRLRATGRELCFKRIQEPDLGHWN